MKKLTKIKLINWHGFYNDTVSVHGSALVTGENGSGKSTLLDALFFVLSGGDTNKFNSAANEKTSRDLTTYMRGKTGAEGSPYLRNDVILTSHIALEFYDEETQIPFVIGTVLEIQENKTRPNISFYHIKNAYLDDKYYLEEKDGRTFIFNYAKMRKLFKEEINDLGDSKFERRRNIYAILSLQDKKYNDLLPKALAFKPIDDVDDFVYQFLMPEKDVDLESIKAPIMAYRDIQMRIDGEKNKLEVLSLIIQDGDSYLEKKKESLLLEAYLIKKDMLSKEGISKNNTRNIKINTKKADIKDNEIQSQEELKSQYSQTLYGIENNQAFQNLQKINYQITQQNNEIKRLDKEVAAYNEGILEEQKLAERLKIKTSLSSCIKKGDASLFVKELESYHTAFQQQEEENNQTFYQAKLEQNQLIKKIDSLKETIDKLRKGIHLYDPKLLSLQRKISEAIKEKLHYDVKPIPLCELIDIKPEEEAYRPVIEIYLASKRFDLFVPKECYEVAYQCYESCRVKDKITDIGLVDIQALENKTSDKASLADKIVSENEDAKAYIASLLGDLKLVEEKELFSSSHTITSSGFLYEKEAIRQLDMAIAKAPFIGLDAIQIQLKKAEEDLALKEKELAEVTKITKQCQAMISEYRNSNYNFLKQVNNPWQSAYLAKEKLKALQLQIEELKKESDLFEKHQSLEKKIQQVTWNIQEANAEKTEIVAQIKLLQERNKNLSAELEELERNFERFFTPIEDSQEDFASKDRITEEEFISYFKAHNYSAYEGKQKLKDLESILDRLEKNLSRNMNSYIQEFSFDSTNDIDSLNTFYVEYHRINDINLAQYQNKLVAAQKSATLAFQSYYIDKIRLNIREEEKNIASLNKILQTKPFGASEDIYQFEISASKNSEFAPYYAIFKSNENFSNTLFSEGLSSQNEALMKELFDKLITESNDEKGLKTIKAYTDYRKFMSYDILITNKSGKKYRFSKISKEKSGGETQTPFYVIIAASFDQIAKSSFGNHSRACIVMLDEAFEKMDESHVNSMMQYFSNLSIQPIIAVPTQHSQTIMPHVDTTIALLKISDRVYPRVVHKVKDDE